MSQPAVVFDHVWKKFRRGERHSSLRDFLPALAKSVLRRRRRDELEGDREFWALRDVSFEVRPGEALGIIGPNGAGKSTTLKLLTKILRPTRGSCYVRGRVGALIEVAAGFHPDLTGRENIFLQGAIMGMRREEIRRRLDDIIDFAGVSDFVDTPVKRYSSGMNARLGFSIAAHLDPQVLIVDEVLSVGDAAFQTRCVERMHRFRREGVTIVFVSHNLQAVSSLCDTTLFVRQGVQAMGPTQEVLMKYVASSTQSTTAPSAVSVSSAGFEDQNRSVTVAPGARLKLRAVYRAQEPVEDLAFGFLLIRSTDSFVVHEAQFSERDLLIDGLKIGKPLSIDFDFTVSLTRGQYHINCYVLHEPTQRVLGRLNPAGLIRVEEHRTHRGIADLDLQATAAGSIAAASPAGAGARR